MIISLNWLKKYTDIDISVQDLATLVGSRLVEIEEIEYLGDKYKDVVIVKAVEVSKIDGSDHLSLVKIDDGGTKKDIVRDENGYVQVVCGAPNISSNQTVVWLPPESIVPETYHKSNEFKLGVRNLRGLVSNGMIASAKELDLSDDHDGILVIPENEIIQPGTSFNDAYEMDDYLLHIENKSLTHRPDCFGMIGFAREVSAIIGKKYKTVDWLINSVVNEVQVDDSIKKINISIESSEICPRYSAVVLSNADTRRKSPLLIQTYLSRVGVRPINSVVDVTNYLMMATGQPLHAFDYDKLVKLNNNNAEICVRLANDNEELVLLDNKTIKLSSSDIVISSGLKVVGLAGAMGGLNTAIDDNTKRIILESATFNLYNLRSTQMRHGIFSEAITRFTKGQPAELSGLVLAKACQMMSDWSGADIVSKTYDSYVHKIEQAKVNISVDFINQILGSDYDKSMVINTLTGAEFTVIEKDNELAVEAPYWRSDIHIKEDIVEEVGRLIGFDEIKPSLPKRDFTAVSPSDFDIFRLKIRKILSRNGANELLNYSFLHSDVIAKANQNVMNSYRLVNSISPDLQYFRQSLTPSLLNCVHPNIKQGFDSFSIYEINKIHQKSLGLTSENVPCEINSLSLVVASRLQDEGSAYFKSKQILDNLGKLLRIEFRYKPIEGDNYSEDVTFLPYDLKRSALVCSNEDVVLGIVGEYKRSVKKGFKLPDYISGYEINLDKLFEVYNEISYNYSPLSKFPSTERDICFRVDKNVYYSQIEAPLRFAMHDDNFLMAFMPIDIYQSAGSKTKNITFRIKFTSYNHTPDNTEINTLMDEIIKKVKESVDTEVI